MPDIRKCSAPDIATPGGGSAISTGHRDGDDNSFSSLDKSPCLRVRTTDGQTVVDILNAETLFDWGVIENLGVQLRRLVEGGHSRLLLNLGKIKYMSSDVLGTLAMLHRQMGRANGRLALCALNPTLRKMMRICSLDRVFDIYRNENDALRGIRPLNDDRGPE
jgi:anti-anti-sigma factor